jgi:hypothetical protein
MGATKIMVIRHAEKPGSYNGAQYAGVNNLGTVAGVDGAKHLVDPRLGARRRSSHVVCGALGTEASAGDPAIPVRLQPDCQTWG